ncbi:unnamed protein product, partial [Heterosigma akashiwo]
STRPRGSRSWPPRPSPTRSSASSTDDPPEEEPLGKPAVPVRTVGVLGAGLMGAG